MYIQKLKVENLRGIGSDDRGIDLNLARPDGSYAGFTVLAGPNGSGKTTLLQAIALTLAGPRALRTALCDTSTWKRQTAKHEDAHVVLWLERDPLCDPQQGKGAPSKAALVIGLVWPPTESSVLPYLFLNEKQGARGPWSQKDGWFLAGYGPFRRLSGHSTDAASVMAPGAAAPELATLFREDASLAEGVQMLRGVYLRRLENKPGAAELEKGMIALLNDGLLPGGLQVLKIDGDALWVRGPGGVTLPISSISDGYRATVALVLDLLYQMCRFFPDFHIDYEPDGSPLVPYSGVVLIDELELHLHPSWQQKLGFWLKKHFPRIQFIVTTHSPFVCQAADPRGLIRLQPDPLTPAAKHLSDEEYNRVVHDGADSAVVTSLFGLDSPYSSETEALRERLSQLEAKQLQGLKLTKADKTELELLHSQIPNTASAAVEAALRRLAVKP